jgi:hypothetical protein
VVNLVAEAIAETMNNAWPRCPARKTNLFRQPARNALDRGKTTPHSRVARQPGMQGMGETADRIQPRRDRPGKRIPLRDELFDVEKKRVGSDKLVLIGRMASPHWYCRIRDRFEMIRPG